jgi:hypothetical protein
MDITGCAPVGIETLPNEVIDLCRSLRASADNCVPNERIEPIEVGRDVNWPESE